VVRDKSVKHILFFLLVQKGETIFPHETLLFFDEIQSCPAALNALKYFCERYKPAMVYRVSTKNFGFENGIKSIPLYAVFCI